MSWVTNSLREIIIKTQDYVGTDNVIFYQEFLTATLEILSDIMTTLERMIFLEFILFYFLEKRQTYLINSYLPLPNYHQDQVLITKQKLHEATIYLPKLKDFIDSVLLLVEIVNSCGTGNEMLFFRKFSVSLLYYSPYFTILLSCF
jgi:hypothetical protein